LQEPWTLAPDPPKLEQQPTQLADHQIPVQQKVSSQRLCQQKIRFEKTTTQGNGATSSKDLHWVRRTQGSLPDDNFLPSLMPQITDAELYGYQEAFTLANETTLPYFE